MPWPNFVIIGAGRGGTTSLYHYLSQHPDVFVSPIKETNYFAYDPRLAGADSAAPEGATELFPIRSPQAYQELFQSRRGERALGEASPIYLYSKGTEKRLYEAIPNVRIVGVFRNPVDRAHSAYLKHVRDGLDSRTFFGAIADELSATGEPSMRGSRNYLRAGLYWRHLSRYLEYFDRRQVAMFLFEDLAREPASVMARLFEFLNVDSGFVPDCTVRYNPSGIPKSRALHRLLTTSFAARAGKRVLFHPGLKRLISPALALQRRNLRKPEFPEESRETLMNFYREDIQNFQELLGRDLSHWLAPG